jgi:hypothetical protein
MRSTKKLFTSCNRRTKHPQQPRDDENIPEARITRTTLKKVRRKKSIPGQQPQRKPSTQTLDEQAIRK